MVKPSISKRQRAKIFPDLSLNRCCIWHCILWLAKEIETSAVFPVLLFLMQDLTSRDEVVDKALSKPALLMVWIGVVSSPTAEVLPQTNAESIFQFVNKIKDFPFFNCFKFPSWGLPWTIIWLIFDCLCKPQDSSHNRKMTCHYFSTSCMCCHFDSCFQNDLSQGEVKGNSLDV